MATAVSAAGLLKARRRLVTAAAGNGNLEQVQELVAADRKCLKTRDGFGLTALQRAAAGGWLPVVRFLVEEAGVSSTSTCKRALMLAAQHGHLPVVQYFVEECGAKVAKKNALGHTALSLACMTGQIAVVRYLVDRGGARSVHKTHELLCACYHGHLEVTRFLVEEAHASAARRVKKYVHQTPLHGAACQGALDVVQYLVEHTDCDVNSRDKHGTTPLIAASMRGHLSVVRYLIDAGADVFAEDNWGGTCFTRALGHENTRWLFAHRDALLQGHWILPPK